MQLWAWNYKAYNVCLDICLGAWFFVTQDYKFFMPCRSEWFNAAVPMYWKFSGNNINDSSKNNDKYEITRGL